jgi:tetratricopeptide (TPR) repeat protein
MLDFSPEQQSDELEATMENDGLGRAGKIGRLAACFGAGDLDAAEQIARQLIADDRQDEEALHLFAQIVFKQGRTQESIELMKAVLEIDPMRASYNNDYGVMLASIDRWDEAAAAYGMAVVLDRKNIDAQYNLALSFLRTGQKERARIELDRALAMRPDLPEALALNGELLHGEGLLAEAVEAFTKAIEGGLKTSNVYVNLGLALESMNSNEEDIQILQKRGEVTRATECFERAIDSYKRALEINPRLADAWTNLGHVYYRLHRLEEAGDAYRRSMEIRPDYVETDFNLGLLLLLRGEFSAGWPRYEARWRMPDAAGKRPKFSQPEWNGDPLGQRMLLVYSEQGLGDNLQFARYLPLLRQRYPEARIYYWCAPPLYRLFESCAASWGIEVLPPAAPGGLPPIDVQIALMSLPGRMGTTLESIPADIPYIVAPPELSEKWSARLKSLPGRKVGVVWAGEGNYRGDMCRSLRLRQLEPLLGVGGLSWVSLQKGNSARQIAAEGLSGSILNVMDEVEDFADTAAIIAHLDLVISVDTSALHLAGAMGKPVWLLNRFDTDWRWLLEREDSPWYPTMRIFRQSAFGDWNAVLPRVAEALTDWVMQGGGDPSRTLAVPELFAASPTVSGPALKLNLGCGNLKMKGFVNVDCVAICQPDMLVDLEKTPWPWEDDSVDEIKLIHVLEHLGQQTDVFLSIIKEMYRVCRDGARIEITVPHPRSEAFLGDPTHVRPVTGAMLHLFSQKLNRECVAAGASNTPLGLILGVDFEIESNLDALMPFWQTRLSSGQMSEAEVRQAARQYNNVISQSTFIWRARKPA